MITARFLATDTVGATPFFIICGAGAEPSPLLLRPFIGLLYQPCVIYNNCGAISGMNDWQEKPKYSEKTYPQCRSVRHIPHDLAWARIPTASMESRRLTYIPYYASEG
jgi:hypothetical protein